MIYGSITTPLKDLQTYKNGDSAFGGALTCMNSSSGACTPTNTLPPGSKIYLMDGTYTRYLTNTTFGQYRFAAFWQLTGCAPTGAAHTGPIGLGRDPGRAGANSPSHPKFIPRATVRRLATPVASMERIALGLYYPTTTT